LLSCDVDDLVAARRLAEHASEKGLNFYRRLAARFGSTLEDVRVLSVLGVALNKSRENVELLPWSQITKTPQIEYAGHKVYLQ
jgi:hypothetical protein